VTERTKLLLVSGSLRARSTNTAALVTLRLLAPPAASATLYGGLGDLPPFNPDDDVDPLPASVAELRRAIHDADVVVFSTPEYAGALPGSFKNLLDWTIGDDQPGSIYEKPVAWINTSPRGASEAYASLRTVLGYAHATIVEAACVHIPVTSADVDASGLIASPAIRAELSEIVPRLVDIDGVLR
jgi:chromate reductase